LGDEAAAELAEMPAVVRPGAERIGLLDAHLATFARSGVIDDRPDADAEDCKNFSAARAAWIKARILSGSFSPGARSTPDDTSTPAARVTIRASRTLAASRPPESM